MTGITRRRFLGTVTAAAGLAVVDAGCSNDDADESRGGKPGSDLDLAARGAGIELLTIQTYTTMTALAVEGRLGAVVPPAVTGLTSKAIGHHQEHLDAWQQILAGGGRRPVESTDAQLKPKVEAAVTRLVDIPGLVSLALRVEDYTAQAYLQAIPTLTSPEVIRTVAQIVVVDQQRQAILRYLLGLHPVGTGVAPEPRAFAPANPTW